ncbi:HAD family hydrolase [Sphingomonas sp. SUN039]|uniref:HAD family hydrolase n=1 Tax=Sphingomonas sp. SUN039 TaxID=2937787 RepID=UPI0038D3DA69
MAVHAVVFDVGKVLVEWGPHYLYDKLIPDAADRAAFLRDVVTTAWHFQHDAGRPFAETSAELIAEFPQHRALIEVWGPRFLETIPHLIPGMADLVAELAARDVALFGITNFSGEFWKPFVAREAVLFAPFRDIVVSGDEKLVKPDPAIYRLALRRFGLQPGEAMFIDDNLANVQGAEAEGFVGHHFVDAPTLLADLIARGLL